MRDGVGSLGISRCGAIVGRILLCMGRDRDSDSCNYAYPT